MTQEELSSLLHVGPPSIRVDQLDNRSDRTLIYGYNMDRLTVHLYLKNELFYYIVYLDNMTRPSFAIQGATEVEIEEVLPGKRAYPEACDFEFCWLVYAARSQISFTTFAKDWEKRHPKEELFAGKILNFLGELSYSLLTRGTEGTPENAQTGPMA